MTATASASCSAGRPQVTLGWEAVPKATGYRVERQAASGSAWVPLAVVAGPAVGFTDTLVGEGQTTSYRVTPLRHRLV